MSFLIDSHCHPTLKHFLFGHSLFRKSTGTRDTNYTNIQVTEPSLRKAGVKAVLAAHYLPERPIKDDWKVIDGIKPLKKIVERFVDKLEGDDAFAQTIAMMEEFESEVNDSNTGFIAHNFGELERSLAGDRTVFVHTIEGGHHLGRGLNAEQYRAHIAELKRRGVAMFTLCHFYANDITTPTEGLPPGQKKLLGMQYEPAPSSLTENGRAIVEELLRSGIVIDLTHTNQQARSEIFEMNRQMGNRPLVFSHTGVRALFKDKEYPHFSFICPDDDELLQIRNCNGVVGVIFMNYFLTGKEEKPLSNDDYGLQHLLATIRHIAAVTGSFDHIAIGSDMDGMIDPPDDLYDSSMLGTFSEALHRHKEYLGATDEDIEKIRSGNILRVLREGWTP